MIDPNAESILLANLKSKVCIENVTLFYEISIKMKAAILSEKLLLFIERHFTLVSRTQSFFKLSVSSVLKIISSNNLDITSEIEVFAAADDWVSYNLEQRNQHAI